MTRQRRAVLGLTVLIGAAILSSGEVRRWLENAYIGAPVAWLANTLRANGTAANGESCLPALTASGRPFTPLPETDFPPDCPVIHPVALDWPLRRQRFMTCGLATAVHAYYADGLQPLAQRILGRRVTQLADLGVRNCRPMRGHRYLLSEHAFANAIDLSEFELDDGSVVRVVDAWNGQDRQAWFVHEAARRACDYFTTVITPDHDADHYNHIHADAGWFTACLLDEPTLDALRARFANEPPPS